jgi:general stress protein YciG/hemerythrin superfamily protein
MAGSNKRGFGSMNQDKQRAIARKGGQAGHAKGTAHEFTSDEAREAGRKGGEAVSRDREHMAEIARKGNRGGGGRSRQTVRSTGRRSDAEGDGMMATDMLRADHERVKGLFHDYDTADDENVAAKTAIAQKVFMELEIHSKIEEEIFYPAVREQGGDQGEELVNEAVEEHSAVKGLIEELRAMTSEAEDFDDKFQDLIDNVLHHAEEEESEMFPLAEEKMGDALQRLGAQMAERKRQLMSSAQVT